MSRTAITISDEDITNTEAVLLRKGERFDEERRRFIKSLETIDLQAVPGSGKTTALLAKLLILERHLPFEDGSGILVLSHTNAAIDEIARRIGTHSPRLFGYPSFVGTIQSFVDHFLAIPYYAGRYGKRPHAINDELYIERAQRFEQTRLRDFTGQEQTNAKYYLNLTGIVDSYRFDIRDNQIVILRQMNGNILDFTKPRGRTKPQNYRDFSSQEKDGIKKWLIQFKKAILVDQAILHFDDAYFLAGRYIARYPNIKTLLQQRFRYVFVDEMQDIDRHQHDLLEHMFAGDANGRWAYQRIGDKSQAIYSHEVRLEEIWSDRPALLRLTGSLRLPPTIAKAVEPFGSPRATIEGRNCRGSDLPPHVIVFDDDSKGQVIQEFCRLLREFTDAARVPENQKYPFKAIAWRKGDDGRFGLKDYWGDYEVEAVKSKIHHTCLKSYLSFARHEGWQADGLTPIYRKIIDGLLGVLRREAVANPNGKAGYLTERSLLKYLREAKAYADFYDRFRMKLFHWSRDIYQGKADEVYPDMKGSVPELLLLFGKRLDKASAFVNDESPIESSGGANASTPAKPQDNIYRCPATGIEVHVGTVHSAKGETHTATLYMESYYSQDGKVPNAKSYESQRLKGQFAGKDLPDAAGERTKQSARMVYVGFSRPTHLLCFAVHKNRFDEALFRRNGWEVVYACRDTPKDSR